MTNEQALRKALEYYANDEHYDGGDVPGHIYVLDDHGRTARQALAIPPSMPAQQGEEERREDTHELANAIVIAWEKSPHDFPLTYPNQLQMALIAARFLVDLATPPSQDQKGVDHG